MNSVPRSQRRGRRTTVRKPSLLIVHFDADKLRRDGLHLQRTASLAGALAALGFNASVECIDVRDRADIDMLVSNFTRAGRCFDVVVAIGHSNAEEIVVAPDVALTWEAFARCMKPVRPKRLLLIACEAGRWPAADTLFTKLPTLRRIYASPVRASKELGAFMLAVSPYLVGVKVPRPGVVSFAQAVALALSGGQVREWKRDADKGNEAGSLLDVAAVAADRLARQVPSLLRGLVK